MMRSLSVGSDGSWTQGPAPGDSKRFSGVVPPAALVFLALVFVAGAIVTLHHKEVRVLFAVLHCRLTEHDVDADHISRHE